MLRLRRLRRPTLLGVQYRVRQAVLRIRYAQRAAVAMGGLLLRPPGQRPEIAAVLVGRNDDYMPDFYDRLRATISWNVARLAKEVVFVEWNPPPGRPLLAPRLAAEFACLKAFVIPNELHRAVGGGDLPLVEFNAKNVGIRRATTPWIVATNADAAFGLDTTLALSRAVLSPSIIWTAQRVDIPWSEGRTRSVAFSDCLRYRRMIPYEPLGTGEFALAHRSLWERARGYDEAMMRHRLTGDMRGTAQMRLLGGTTQRAGLVLHLAHPTSCTEGVRPHHGEFYPPLNNLPYHNPDTWGLAHCRESEIDTRVWRLD